VVVGDSDVVVDSVEVIEGADVVDVMVVESVDVMDFVVID
jgi:hypothetical protein